MSISSIVANSSIMSFQGIGDPASPQGSVSTLVSQLEKSISAGNLDTTQTIVQALKALAPAGTSASNPLSVFLNSVSTAVQDGSTSEAETALSTFQATTAAPPTTPISANAEKSAIGKQLLEDKLTLNLVKEALAPLNSANATATSTTNSAGISTDSTGTSADSSLNAPSLTIDESVAGTFYSATA
jgi:hypothetical protein